MDSIFAPNPTPGVERREPEARMPTPAVVRIGNAQGMDGGDAIRGSVLSFRHAQHEAVERLGHHDLAGQPAVLATHIG